MKKAKNELSVFGDIYMGRARWWQIPRKVKLFVRAVRNGWMRATRGFCPQDWWNFDWYFAALIRDIFEHYSENHVGHPHNFSPNKWTEVLDEIKECAGEYAKEVDEHPMCADAMKRYEEAKRGTNTAKNAFDYWMKCRSEVEDAQLQSMQRAVGLIMRYYRDLWD